MFASKLIEPRQIPRRGLLLGAERSERGQPGQAPEEGAAAEWSPRAEDSNRILFVRSVGTLILAIAVAGCAPLGPGDRSALIPATTTMVTAWDCRRTRSPIRASTSRRSPNRSAGASSCLPTTPRTRRRSSLAADGVRELPSERGTTRARAAAGRRRRHVSEYNARAARLITLADRVVDCFLRSENATGHVSGRAADIPPRKKCWR